MIYLKIAKRDEIEQKYKWDLSKIYKSLEEWEQEYNEVNNMLTQFEQYRGRINKSSDILYECLQKCDIIGQKAERLFVYAKMKRDEDNSNSVYQSLTDRANFINTNVEAAISFIQPEIVSMSEQTIEKYMKENTKLQVYRQFFNNLLREKEHTLSPEIEEVLALSYDVCNVPENIFTMFNNADIKFPFIKNEKGEEVELTKGRYSVFLESNNREVRRDAFLALYNTYAKNINTVATALIGNVKADKFLATVRSITQLSRVL